MNSARADTMGVFVCFLLTILMVASYSMGAVLMTPSEVDPSSEDKCVWVDPETNNRTFHNVGSSWPIEGCKQITCERKKGALYLVTVGCGLEDFLPPCEGQSLSNLNAVFPECCPRVYCP
ncbi:hypothetical protein J437_LFUL004148 [Ladona fulva]|uniref:Single domain-containing protein n=1 Tax=Ladona fulva TaxID=123851 RepID=A0A8K0NY53_LADFU|nr:hypothetical protein J437_LFUL004148 [Ladona fulva]